MKHIIYLILISLFASSCSNSDDNNQETPKSVINIKLKAEQTTGNIFDLFVFNLYSEEAVSLYDISNTYDSLVWTIPDLGSYNLLEKNSFMYQWSQVFFLPGKYTTILLGYKENKVITSDTININILQKNNDFLYFDWKNIKESWGSTGYSDLLANDYSFATYQSLKDGIPSVTLFLLNEKKSDEIAFAQKSKIILSDYITSLYAEPSYTEKNTTQLIEEYNKLFNNKVKDAKPLSIWITAQSRILLYALNEGLGYNEYRIMAEPNLH